MHNNFQSQDPKANVRQAEENPYLFKKGIIVLIIYTVYGLFFFENEFI